MQDESWRSHQPASAARWSPEKGMWPTTGKCSGRQLSLVDEHWRASMAILLDINRRQLLTSTATVAVAGIAPKVAQSKALAKSEITQQPTTEAPPVTEASNFDNITILRIR